jgi:nitrogen fixation NifU-like protein
MAEDWDKVMAIAKQMEEEAYKGYSKTALDHGKNPRYVEELEEYNAFDLLTGPCGDTMAFWLNIKDGVIDGICFTTDGCKNSCAAGSMTCELAKGKTLADARQISQQDVLDALGGLPEEHCALLSTDTLKKAIDNYPGASCG